MTATSTDGGTIRRKRRRTPFAQVPDALIRDRRVSGEAVRLWALLDRYIGDHEAAWPGQDTLAEDLGRSVPSVQRDIRALRDAGWLEVHRTTVSGRLAGNEYVLVEDPADATDDASPVMARDASPVMARDASPVMARDTSPVMPLMENESQKERKPVEGEGRAGASTPPPPKTSRRPGPMSLAVELPGVREVFEAWREATGRTRATALDETRAQVIQAALEAGYPPEDLADAVRGATLDPWHNGSKDNRRRYDLPLLLGRAERIEALRDLWREKGTGPRVDQTQALARQLAGLA